MRGISSLYLFSCEEEGCETNSRLVEFFCRMDTLDLSDMLRACPAHLDLSNNYLGDGGAAAFVRVLTMLRWVKSVDLRGVGAGARTIRALCDLLAVETPVAAGKAYTTTHDVDGSSTVVLPCVGLTHVDLRQNDVFAMSARKLLTALRHRRHRLAIFLATTPHVAVPTMEVELDWDELPPTTADALRELNAQGADQHERVAAATEREKAEERLRIFCSTDDAQQPLGQHVMYRIPERLPTTAQDDGGDGATTTTTTSSSPSAPSYFYDVDDPSMVRLVRDMNNHMESYLAAYRCFTAMDEDDENDAPRTSSSSSRTFGNRAAAQVCVELGADTLNFLGHTNAAVWYACADRTSVLDDARFGPLMLREHPSITRTRYRRKMEVLANIHALLRGFYANPFLEEEVMAQRGAILGGYLRTLKEKYYESSAREKMMREEVCSRLRELDAELAEMDAETAEVEVGYDGSRAMRERRATLMSTATDLRRRMKEVSAGALVVDEEEEQRLEVMASLYHRIVSALVSRRMDDLPSMKHFEHRLRVLRTWMIAELFDGTSVEDLEARQRRLRAEAMYLVLPSQRYAAPLGRGEFRTNNNNNTYNNTPSSVAGEAISSPCTASTSPYRRVLPLWCAKMKYVLLNAPEEVSTWNSHYAGKATPSPFRIDSHAPLKSNTNNNTKMMMDEPHEAATTTTTPGAACTCQHQHDVRPHAHPRPNGEPPFLYHPLPRPCASCCHAAIANLPEMLRDVHLHARLDATSQMREALPMEVKLFLLDMMVRRRSSSSYIPCMFSSVDGTQLEVVQTCEANTYKKTTTQEGANDDDNDEDEDASSSSSSSCISATGGHAYPHTSLHPTSPLLSVLDVLACVDGRRKQLVRVVSAFEEWYRLRMVESFDVSDPHFVPRPSAFMCGGAEDDDADEDGVGGTHDVDAHRNEEEVVAVQS